VASPVQEGIVNRGCTTQAVTSLDIIGICSRRLDAYSGRKEGWTFNPPYFAAAMT
jgi:hypothetical protein